MAAAALFPPRPLRLAEALAVARAPLARATRRARRGRLAAIARRSRRPAADLGRTGRDLLARRRVLDARPGEIHACKLRHPLAELLAQRPRPHLLDCAFRELAELERAERHPDQPAHRQAEVAEHILDLAVL